jgi:SAM-dependent methyltransferase
MKWFMKNYVKEKSKVLDVGACDHNGSYRALFEKNGHNYYGLDMEDSLNVDILVENPYDWTNIPDDTFDVVVSGQTFEHNEFFWVTMDQMTRVLKPEGLMCIIAPCKWREHRYPVDCYRFFSDGMVALARYNCLIPYHASTNCAPTAKHKDWFSANNVDSMLVAMKPYAGEARHPDFKNYVCEPPDQKQLRTKMVPYRRSMNLED